MGRCWSRRATESVWWRLPRAQWVKEKGGGNKASIRKLVTERHVPGILAYVDGQPVGWCAIGPRETYPRLANSRILKPVDAHEKRMIGGAAEVRSRIFKANSNRFSACSRRRLLCQGRLL